MHVSEAKERVCRRGWVEQPQVRILQLVSAQWISVVSLAVVCLIQLQSQIWSDSWGDTFFSLGNFSTQLYVLICHLQKIYWISTFISLQKYVQKAALADCCTNMNPAGGWVKIPSRLGRELRPGCDTGPRHAGGVFATWDSFPGLVAEVGPLQGSLYAAWSVQCVSFSDAEKEGG